MHIRYRMSQFWRTLRAKPSAAQFFQAQQVLSPDLMTLFLKMQAGEQFHSLAIYEKLTLQGENNPDLLAAALLHDVGKIRFPLNLFERVLIVVGQRFFPDHARNWGQGAPQGWKRPFVVAAQHADWGAELADTAGATPLTVELIRQHQTKPHPDSNFEYNNLSEMKLLYRLQMADDES